MMSKRQTAESFWAKVDIKGLYECWNWKGARNSTGYGTVTWGGKVYTAHRVAAWIRCMVINPSAPKLKREKTFVLHKCDNRLCCNPEHFFLGNYSDNQKDAHEKKQRAQPKGASHVNAKLTSRQVAQIRKRYSQGELQVPLAKKYRVSQRTISLIVRGETYK
jgi:hypothetical protein